MDNDVQRREWIKARIEAIHEELDKLLRELGAPETGIDEAEQRRRKFTLYKGGLGVLLLLLSLGYFLTRYRRPLLAAAASAAAAVGIVAVAVLGHSAPPGAAPSHVRSPRPAVSASAPASAPTVPRPTSRPRPRNTPLVPVVVPTRLRRTASTAASTPVDFGPIPSPQPSSALPTSTRPSPTHSPPPTPGALACPVGLRLVVLGSGLTVCV